MLTLNRRRGQSILIGPIVIKVVSIDRGAVELGITAPPDFEISRSDNEPDAEEVTVR